MENRPTISVIIPTFNRGPICEEAVQSVLGQSLGGAEIVVVDDGSSDDTAARMARYPAVTYLRQENSGASVARNRGVLASRGELIAFLDSDDLFVPTHLEESARFLAEEPGVDFVFGDIEKFNGGGVVMESFFKGKLIEGIPFEDRGRGRRVFTRSVFPELIAGNFIPTPTLVLRRECFVHAGLFDPDFRFLNDADMYLRVVRKFRGGYFNKVMARVRVGDDNLTHGKWAETRFRTRLRLMAKISNHSQGLAGPERDQVDRQLEETHFGLAYQLYAQGKHGEARTHLRECLRRNPAHPMALKLFLKTLIPAGLAAKARAASAKP